MSHKFVLLLILSVTGGCTSFRTTALYRFANDSVTPEATNRCLKGLPVKLKIPSHVHVTVYEQQVLLANSENETSAKQQEAVDAAARVQFLRNQISLLRANLDGQRAAIERLERARAELDTLIGQLDPTDPQFATDQKALNKLVGENTTELANTRIELSEKLQAAQNEADLHRQLEAAIAAAEVAASAAAIGYTLISFDPAQFTVESELQYTDKVFLVDFKRPAGGILDLQEASMDDEQYFSKIQAEVEERTLADISTALETVKDPLTRLANRNGNQAIPTSAATSIEEAASTVNFQKSVVATQRFDISEPGWEQRLQGFVNEHIGAAPMVTQDLGVGPTAPAAELSPLPNQYLVPTGDQLPQGELVPASPSSNAPTSAFLSPP